LNALDGSVSSKSVDHTVLDGEEINAAIESALDDTSKVRCARRYLALRQLLEPHLLRHCRILRAKSPTPGQADNHTSHGLLSEARKQ
jgi:hypothetical protein